MSLNPLLFSDWWDDLKRPHRLLNQNFGSGIHPEHMPSSKAIDRIYMNTVPQFDRSMDFRTPLELLHQRKNKITVPPVEKDDFQVIVDVQQFEPEEIEVKIVDNYIVITAKHEEKQDQHGWVSRQFVRKYTLPENCNLEQLISRLSSDGLLTITAPKKQPEKGAFQRTIKIEHTGQPFVNKQQEKSKISKEDAKDKKPTKK